MRLRLHTYIYYQVGKYRRCVHFEVERTVRSPTENRPLPTDRIIIRIVVFVCMCVSAIPPCVLAQLLPAQLSQLACHKQEEKGRKEGKEGRNRQKEREEREEKQQQ